VVTDRLKAIYDLTGILVHQPKHGPFGGLIYGNLVTYSSRLEAPGFEIAESIELARQHLKKVQEAINNMERILDEAEPVKQEN